MKNLYNLLDEKNDEINKLKSDFVKNNESEESINNLLIDKNNLFLGPGGTERCCVAHTFGPSSGVRQTLSNTS